MLNYIWVMLGGAFGTERDSGRQDLWRNASANFSRWVSVVNITGSLIAGFFAALTDPQGPFLVSPQFRQFFMIGVCGGYTTFSSFSLQTLDLFQEGDWFKGSLNTLLSFVCCLTAVWIGRALALVLFPK